MVSGFGAIENARAIPQAVTWTGSNTFTDEILNFSGFEADSILGITGGGFFHGHTALATATVRVILDGVLTDVFSFDAAVGENVDDALGGAGKVRRFGRERGNVFIGVRLIQAAEQTGEPEPGHAHAAATQKAAPCQGHVLRVERVIVHIWHFIEKTLKLNPRI